MACLLYEHELWWLEVTVQGHGYISDSSFCIIVVIAVFIGCKCICLHVIVHIYCMSHYVGWCLIMSNWNQASYRLAILLFVFLLFWNFSGWRYCQLQIISQALQSASLSTVCTYSAVDVRATMSAIVSSIQKQSVTYSAVQLVYFIGALASAGWWEA